MDILRALGLKGAGRMETDLAGARRLAQEEREARLRDAYPKCSRICAEVLAVFSGIRKCCDLFEQSKAEINPEMRSSVKGITRTMRKNFIARMRSAVALEAAPGMEYGQLTEFSRNLQETVGKIAKINSDNRYVFQLYKEDTERFKEPFERAQRLSNDLKEKLEEKRGEAEKFGQLISLIDGFGRERERLAKLESEAAEAEGRLAEKRAELAGFGESRGLEAKLEELSRVSADLSSAGGRISASVSVLERALRKYGKVCDPPEKPERYVEAPISELLAEGVDYPGFRKILVKMGALIKKGGLELKNPEKVEAQIDWLLSGGLGPLLAEYARLGGEKGRLEKELEPLRSRERTRQGLESAIEQLADKLQKQKHEIAGMKADFEAKKGELERKFGEVVGKEIVLTASGAD